MLAPVLVAQALWVVTRAARLPEAAGARRGRAGAGREMRLLVLGDSSAAGVGVAHQEEALAGRLSALLAASHDVSWELVAKSGATTATALAMVQAMPAQRFDFVVIALGVNDAKNGVSLRAWQSRYTRLLDEIARKFVPRRVCVSGLPPLRDFPILPRPLADVIGARAERFDAALATICAARDGVIHLPFDLALTPDAMASDGFHPGAVIYQEWADRAIRSVWQDAGTDATPSG